MSLPSETFDVVFDGHCWRCDLPVQTRVMGVGDRPHDDHPELPCPVCDEPVTFGWHLAPAGPPPGGVELPEAALIEIAVGSAIVSRLGWSGPAASRAGRVAAETIRDLMKPPA